MTLRHVAQLELPPAPFARRYRLMSESLVVETNDPAMLTATDAAFGRFGPPPTDRPPLVLRIFRDPPAAAGVADSAGARLTHRIGAHLYAVGSAHDLATVDARDGVAFAFLSHATAADLRLVRYSFVEGPALAMLTYGRGYLTLHACGIARLGAGLALLGRAGAGKSTLAVAAARRGLDVFAEDAVFVRAGDQGLEFWGLPWGQRLVPDARRFFPELTELAPTRQPNGELKIEIDLDQLYPGRAGPRAQPTAVVVLERSNQAPEPATLMSDDDVPLELLWPWGDHWSESHGRAARLLSALPRYRLAVGATPDDAIDQLEVLLGELTARTATG